jgi:glycerophosphoryl diester phosphodiesterase
MPPFFELQGHRGARGLKPENTLPSFEAAFDAGVTAVETDVHLTRDGVPVLCHDPWLSDRLCRLLPGATSPDPRQRPLISSLTLAQFRGYRADRNPCPDRFPAQDAAVTPVAGLFAEHLGIDPYAPPTLADLFAFTASYAGAIGAHAGKRETQRAGAGAVQFDLELKRVPFRPEYVGDVFDGGAAGLLEQRLVEVVLAASVAVRTVVRSFDHRCVLAVRQLLPELRTAVLVAGTAPVAAAELARQAGATTYCPEFLCLDEAQVRELHAAGTRVVPWTVNNPTDLARLLDWGVDGVTTDYPDRMAKVLNSRGIAF